MDLRLTFSEDAANYDKMRPTYPKELFDGVKAFSCLDSGKRALEIGIGTGQATLPFLQTGCEITAVELGEELAAFVKAKFASFRNFEVIHGNFEDETFAKNAYDLLYSATAFHWIPDDIGYPKAFRLLKNGGTLALFWNHPAPADDALHEDMQKVYAVYRPSQEKPKPFSEETCLKTVRKIRQFGFEDVRYSLYRRQRSFDAEGYIALLNTYSDHRAMHKEAREALEEGLADAIARHGGVVPVQDTMDLYIAKKP